MSQNMKEMIRNEWKKTWAYWTTESVAAKEFFFIRFLLVMLILFKFSEIYNICNSRRELVRNVCEIG